MIIRMNKNDILFKFSCFNRIRSTTCWILAELPYQASPLWPEFARGNPAEPSIQPYNKEFNTTRTCPIKSLQRNRRYLKLLYLHNKERFEQRIDCKL